MKYFFIPFLTIALFLTSCSDDDSASSCDPMDVAAVLVGSWDESPINGIGDEVTFNSDMTGSTTEESLFSTELNGDVSTTFTWALSADQSVAMLSYPNGLSVDYNIQSVDCDEIDMELFGFTVTLTRQ